ncbi:hypothetical protein AVEN_214287-1 [Araneus ventricosus]|uniref:Uncharacterized protein n=1 Tax=Araneus ventricosus TaxID=182803 RepID=A0A4Y2KVZ2_ARAVE|nr:hypothetical protein AVEN_214287-1 [Araneus ventricosus]
MFGERLRMSLKLGIHQKAKLCHLPKSGLFPPIQVEKLGTSFTEAPKCTTVALRSPYSSFPTLSSSDFLASSRGFWQKLCFPATLAKGSQNVIQPFQSDFKLFGIPNIQSICANFHRFLKLMKGFSFPCYKNSRMEQR